MINGLHHIAVISSDKEKALHFYGEVLGFKAVSEHNRPERNDIIINLQGYGIILELFIMSECPKRQSYPEAYGLRHLALHVTEIEKITEMLINEGYKPEPVRTDAYTGELMTFVLDPDGLPIELHE